MLKRCEFFLFFPSLITSGTPTLARKFSASTKVNGQEKTHKQKKLNDKKGLIQFQVWLRAHEIEFYFRERYNSEIKTSSLVMKQNLDHVHIYLN